MAVQNRTLRLGYVNLIYPILTECGVDLTKWLTCDQPGIAAEIWRVLFPYLNYSSIEFVKINTFGVVANSTAPPDSLFDQLHKGIVDASYQFTIYENDERFGYILYSAPVSTYHFGFVAGDLIDNKQSSLKIEVFQRLPLMLLVLLTLLFGLVHGMINGNIRDGVWRGLSSACMQFKDDPHGIRNPMIVMGYAVLLINYFAGFRGQALSMTISQSPLFQMDHIRQNLGMGKVLLIIAGPTDLGLLARKLLFGDENADLRKFGTIEESNFTLAADLLCNRRDVLFFGSVESLRWGSKQKNCWLRTLRIPFHGGNFLDLTGPFAFALSPKFSRKEKKIMDDIIMRIFTAEHIQEYWMPKYGISTNNEGILADRARKTLQTITTDHIWPAIILAVIGCSLAIVIFLMEYFGITEFLKPLSVRPTYTGDSDNATWTASSY